MSRSLLLYVLLLSACGGETPSPENAEPATARPVTTVEVIREEPPPDEPAEAPRDPMLVKGVASVAPETAPDVRITEPRKNAVVKAGPVKVKLAVKNWPTMPNGPYLAVIVDDRPPIRVDDPAAAVEIADLEEGSHLVRAMAVRSSGESLRQAGAVAATTFHVGRRTANWGFNPSGPYLTLNLPSGTYQGDGAATVMLDFQIANPAAGQKVKVSVGDVISGDIADWVPHHLSDLPDGANTVVLEIVGADGTPLSGAFRRATRTFTIQRGEPAAPAAE